jgi:DNA-binding protein YbaB
MFADLLTATINDAMEKSQTLAANRLRELTGGLGLPSQ